MEVFGSTRVGEGCRIRRQSESFVSGTPAKPANITSKYSLHNCQVRYTIPSTVFSAAAWYPCSCRQHPSSARAEEICNTSSPDGATSGVTLLFTPSGTQFSIMWKWVEGSMTLQMGGRKKTRAESPPNQYLIVSLAQGEELGRTSAA